MDGLIAIFRQYPELSILLALALGYWIGGLQIGTFSLGSVTGTLLMGVLIGQMHITISASVKATFFLMFLFAVGYGAGPEFFRGLKNQGVNQAIFAAVQCVVSLAVGYAVAKALGYDVGQAAGLVAGSQTISGLLGTAAEAINKLALPDDEKKRLVDAMPVAYAVTYIFGTAGSAWILSSLGPKLVGGNFEAACKEYEATRARQSQSAELKLVTRGQPASLTDMLLSARIPTPSSPSVGRRRERAGPSAPLPLPRRSPARSAPCCPSWSPAEPAAGAPAPPVSPSACPTSCSSGPASP